MNQKLLDADRDVAIWGTGLHFLLRIRTVEPREEGPFTSTEWRQPTVAMSDSIECKQEVVQM